MSTRLTEADSISAAPDAFSSASATAGAVSQLSRSRDLFWCEYPAKEHQKRTKTDDEH